MREVLKTSDMSDEEIELLKNTHMGPKHDHLNKELDMNKDTFNGKEKWQNAVAIILGTIGVYFLAHAWAYHMLIQLITIPKDKWISPLDKSNVPNTGEYPNIFCDVLCTVEATMIYQLKLLREGFGQEYCNEPVGEDNVTRI